uniref:uncharacterized protein LOC120336196 n=1 Tax=Styela clava TaxID=7725 RepID=UPI00193A7B09|nr:uncharacterized protein LOC120336196 [Styela clava]
MQNLLLVVAIAFTLLQGGTGLKCYICEHDCETVNDDLEQVCPALFVSIDKFRSCTKTVNVTSAGVRTVRRGCGVGASEACQITMHGKTTHTLCHCRKGLCNAADSFNMNVLLILLVAVGVVLNIYIYI